MMFTAYKGAAKRIDDVDLPRIGSQIGVGEDEIHAFMDVEASGSGFDAEGRVKMLFEPHIFWRQLGAGEKRNAAWSKGLAYEKWKAGAYPRDSYPRLIEAMKIDETAALKSASWGAGQIMGFNHIHAGYATPQAMVEAFAADEENHLQAMVNVIKAFGIDDDLRAHRWDVIERVYNGGGFGGAYAAKMAKAYAEWQKIRDTPWSPQEAQPAPIPMPEPQPPLPPDLPDQHPAETPPAAPLPLPDPGSLIAKMVIGAIGLIIAGIGSWIAGLWGAN